MNLDNLNDKQKEAVLYNEGPLLIIAGAGSGKTRVLTYKVAYLIDQGVDPQNILAITFTNKAASEMKERIIDLLQGKNVVGRPFVSTFHRFCGNILSKYLDRIGLNRNYIIYDTEDQLKLIKNIIKDLFGEESKLKEKATQGKISYCKNHNISPEEYAKDAFSDIEKKVAKIYFEYDERLRKANAVDFDDMLLLAVRILKEDKDALLELNQRFKYILVDEYQDTNGVQFELIKLLTLKHKNITVVGDDDQSIYKFRGADIQNILSFEDSFPNPKVVKLTQNYRSTKQILDVANSVIKNNSERKDKSLWCDVEDGDKVVLSIYPSDIDEAKKVIENIKKEGDYGETCILYRANALSRRLEDMCINSSIPYKLIGSVSFYKRREVKDIFAYLRLIANKNDDLALTRIINVPKRGIGETSLNKIIEYARMNNKAIYEVLNTDDLEKAGLKGKALKAAVEFSDLIESLSKLNDVNDMITKILDSGLENEIRENDDTDTANDRIQNINEIKTKFSTFKIMFLANVEDDVEREMFESNVEFVLQKFLYDISLAEATDDITNEKESITLMTLHASKGLEYKNVYIIGLNEYLFPSEQSIREGDDSEIEEERRLMYVGVTRAKRHLYLSYSKYRMINGMTRPYMQSRFVDEIDKELLSTKDYAGDISGDWEYNDFARKKYNRDYDNDFSDYDSTARDRYSRKTEMSFGRGFTYNNKDADRATKKHIDKYLNSSTADIYKTGKDMKKPESLSFDVGDKVIHSKFGEGVVKKIFEGISDFEVTVAFEEYGEKVLFQRFAKLEKIG